MNVELRPWAHMSTWSFRPPLKAKENNRALLRQLDVKHFALEELARKRPMSLVHSRSPKAGHNKAGRSHADGPSHPRKTRV